MGTATAIAIGVVVVIIPIHAAATTDTVLPATDSATTVQVRCHHCCVRGPVSGVVVNDAVAADAPAAPPLPPSGAMDPMASATAKTRDSTVLAVATVTSVATEEEDYNGWEGADP